MNIAAGLVRILTGLLAHHIRPMSNVSNAVIDIRLPSIFRPVGFPRPTTLKDVMDLIAIIDANIVKERAEVHKPKG